MSGVKRSPRRALVLAGGAAKGAFEAGAIAVLTDRDIEFRSIIGTSVGALNAAFFAAGVRAGRENEAAAEMVDFWVENARWRTFLDLSARDVAGGRGLSRSRRMEQVLHSRMTPLATLAAQNAVQLRMVATLLRASPDRDDSRRYEHIFSFAETDFAKRLEVIAHAAVASSAFPGIFAPVAVKNVGDCVDGGLVANTPLAEASSAGEVDEVFVLSPWPTMDDSKRPAGISLVSQWIEILTSERFNREVAHVEHAHAQLQALADLHERGVLTDWHHRAVRQALGLRHAARVVVIRPEQALPGNLLSGFADRGLRAEYVAQGRAAAERSLSHTEQAAA